MSYLIKPKIAVICGPTATGKTSFSIQLAKHFNGEIICADSMQIYKQLSVGTAKVTSEEMQAIPHHLVDFLSPDTIFSVADFVMLAHQKIAEISARGKLPIIVGGTGLYISSLVNGIKFEEQKTDLTIRSQLENELAKKGIDTLYAELLMVDEQYAKSIDKNNQKRVLRALELYRQTNVTMSQQLENSKPVDLPYDARIIALNFSDREILYKRINQRIDLMLENGLLDEAKLVYDNKSRFVTAAQAIGYKEFFDFFENIKSLEDCTELLKQSSRRYAKRQITWFKRVENINWLMLDQTQNPIEEAIKIII